MLWSQINMTSYDFTDLHITGERFLIIFSCVVTYRTGAGRRLYIKTSADARPGTVRRCKRSARHRTVPGQFYANVHVQLWIYLYQNLPSFLQRNRLLKKRLRLTLTVMMMKTTLAQDCKYFNSTCSLHVNHPQLLKRNMYLCTCFWSLEVKYLCKCYMYFCKNTSLLTCGSLTHKTSACARTAPLESNDKMFEQKSSGACPMCAITGLATYVVILPSMTLPNAVRAPWNFK